jgi:hypothetical protein
MLLTYGALDTTELGPVTPADVLVRVDADLEVLDDDRLLWSEPGFPVVELARALRAWIEERGTSDFAFDSMSFEEVGALTIRSEGEGWVFGSVFQPTTESRPVSFAEVERCTRAFVDRVAADLVSCGLDPALVGR